MMPCEALTTRCTYNRMSALDVGPQYNFMFAQKASQGIAFAASVDGADLLWFFCFVKTHKDIQFSFSWCISFDGREGRSVHKCNDNNH